MSKQIYKNWVIETLETAGDDRWVTMISDGGTEGEELPGVEGSNAAAMRKGREWLDELISNHEEE